MSKTYVIKKDTKVSLRGRINTSGDFVTLYLDWGSGKNRSTNFLTDRIYNIPKTESEIKHNEVILKKAYVKLSVKNAELLNDTTQMRSNNSYISFQDFFEIYKKMPKKNGKPKKDSTLNSYSMCIASLNKYQDLSKTRLRDIDEAWIIGLRQHLLDSDLCSNTAANYLQWFGGILRQAVKKKYMVHNPCELIDTIGRDAPEVNYLLHEDLQKLKAANCPNPVLKKAGLFSSQTGMRSGDMKALKWKNISKVGPLYRIHLKQEKTEKQYIIHFKQSVMDIIGPPGNPDEYVFPKFTNDNLANSHLQVWFLKAGVVPRGYVDNPFTMHDFRHTYAITLGLNGASIYEISQMIGHEMIANTERYYARILEQMKTVITDRLPDL